MNCSIMSRFAAPIWDCKLLETQEAQFIVERLLRLMEDHDLDSAESLMAPEVRITFPGGRPFTSQREVAASAGGRYQWVKKRFEKIESFQQGGSSIVYVLGTLYGVNLNDVPFDDIRFIDRFVVKNGLIVRQDVWNDLAESGVLDRKS
jgi:SnoaL-like domain